MLPGTCFAQLMVMTSSLSAKSDITVRNFVSSLSPRES